MGIELALAFIGEGDKLLHPGVVRHIVRIVKGSEGDVDHVGRLSVQTIGGLRCFFIESRQRADHLVEALVEGLKVAEGCNGSGTEWCRLITRNKIVQVTDRSLATLRANTTISTVKVVEIYWDSLVFVEPRVDGGELLWPSLNLHVTK
jgi:hypothetical protein